MLTTKDGGVPGANTPENSDGLDAAHDQPAKSINKSTRILGAFRKFINRAASGFTIDRGFDAYFILMLILAVFMLVQGVLQWLN